MKVDLLSIFETFDSKSTHHRAAVYLLEETIAPELLTENADWLVCFRAAESEASNPYNS